MEGRLAAGEGRERPVTIPCNGDLGASCTACISPLAQHLADEIRIQQRGDRSDAFMPPPFLLCFFGGTYERCDARTRRDCSIKGEATLQEQTPKNSSSSYLVLSLLQQQPVLGIGAALQSPFLDRSDRSNADALTASKEGKKRMKGSRSF